uniref:Uncharacterized protein n=1 Tax=Ditylenchus dipsaci TaxID=166011 RepID=A0A915CNT2_9BILA
MSSIQYPALFAFFLAVLYPINALPLNSLMSDACQRNPSLAICAQLPQNSNFRAKDAAEGVDTVFMRSFPKVSFEELQTMRYCESHNSKYQTYCANNEQASKIIADSLEYKPKSLSLVVPPSLPSASAADSEPEPVQFDLPLASSAEKDTLYGGGIRTVAQMSPSMIRTCTPDCTAPHCTVECKCHASHPAVNARCNPPANGEIASTCLAWYSKCARWFSPLQY